MEFQQNAEEMSPEVETGQDKNIHFFHAVNVSLFILTHKFWQVIGQQKSKHEPFSNAGFRARNLDLVLLVIASCWQGSSKFLSHKNYDESKQ